MDKKSLIARIRATLEAELAAVRASAAEAHAEATHEDAKAENQYDTRGLEASYLAGAQAGRAADLASRINNLEFLVARDYGPEDPIGLSALIQLDDGETTRQYFLAPEGGGLKLHVAEQTLLVITPKSPIGRAVLEKHLHDIIEVSIRGKRVEMEVVGID